MNTTNLIIMSVFGISIMLSYYVFIVKSFFGKNIDVNKWWFGLDKNKQFMNFFMVSAS